ncbi:MAG: ABC transporter substrate-binding protein [Gammaproteobacteria bacterium]|nr:ABC transporter substrate-binding protein [Gammaproteobacteria bacterium]
MHQSKRESWWRRCLGLLLLALTLPVHAAPSAALGYTPKYPAGFSHFDYVRADAPKGGNLTLAGQGSFDSFNPFILKSRPAAGLDLLVFEPLMVSSLDEPFSKYGLLAEDISLAADKLSVTFRLNPLAKFSNGKPVLARDVKFSFDTLKSNAAHPQYRYYWVDIKRAVVVDARTIRFEFARVNPELYLIATEIPVFSRDWVGDKPFNKVATEVPIGSGPYIVQSFDLGKHISFVRNPNYWGRDLPTRRGVFNFDRITYKYYKDDTIQREAFKAGEYDFHIEYSSKAWARDFVGPAFNDGGIVKKELVHRNNAGMQGLVFNTRRAIFKDKRVRKAIGLAFDFEWSNEHLFYKQYTRCNSYFSNSEMASSGLPQGDELKLLEPYRAQLSPEVFTTVWQPPMTLPPHSLRENLRQARDLLKQAGWILRDGVLRNANGEPLEFEVLGDSVQGRTFERILGPFAQNLKKLGIVMNYRTVDVALWQRRTDVFDFDMVTAVYGESQSPGNELYRRWYSKSADEEGSENLMGVKDPVIDALIDKVVQAPDRKHLVTALKALDRVMLHGEYLVPNWYNKVHRIAYRNKFDMPSSLPLYYAAEGWMIETSWSK